jgi:large subunit ribosomal protein L34
MQLQLRSGIEGRKTRKIWWPERQWFMDDAARGRATTRSSTSSHTHIPQSVAPVMLFLRCTRHIAQARPSLNLASTTSLLQSTLRPLAASQPAQSHVSHRVPPSTHPLTIHRSRTFSLLSPRRPTLPSTPTSTLSLNTTLELPTLPAASTTLTLLQARGPKRDTFDPSHRVRKRRSGFLARIRSRNGRNLIKRRLLKKRSTLSH